jgi:hypothetical protein
VLVGLIVDEPVVDPNICTFLEGMIR